MMAAMTNRALIFSSLLLAAGCSESTNVGVCLVNDPTGTYLGQPSSTELTGTTLGAADDYTPPRGCAAGERSSAPDQTFTWTAPASGTYQIDTNGSAFDAVLAVHRGDLSGPLAGCDDDSGEERAALVQVDVEACESLVIVVDGWNTREGDFSLNIREVVETDVEPDPDIDGDAPDSDLGN